MRQFWVKNAKGQIFDMNREDAFFGNPKGLGIDRDTKYERVGYSYTEVENELEQSKPNGTMVFDGYEQYDEFLDIVKYTPLIFMYQPLDTMYYMDVNTFTIEKTEIDYKKVFLSCKVVFEGNSPWYIQKKASVQSNEAEGKIYEYTYPYQYAENSAGTMALENNSSKDAYCRLIIYGYAEDPSWNLKQDGEILYSGAVSTTIHTGEILVVDSDPTEYEIYRYDESGARSEDLYGSSDFDTERFLYIPPGKSILAVSHSGSDTISFRVEVTEFVG
ncbi:MAG: hypothetical protein LUE31_03050 [Lachnospiraceae bacterium]|nr:hypothetical protein [Lachnospiraceae bacterium]